MSNTLAPVSVEGIAFWSSRLPGWEIARSVIRGEAAAPSSNVSRPSPTLLAPTERRRAPDTVAVALEVAARACEASGRPPAQLPSVFASTHGDLAITDHMCATLAATPTLISPIRFHNSVHNAAAGYLSIGVGSYAPYTALSAFHCTFGMGLLEAATQAICMDQPVLYVASDIEAKGALATVAPSRGILGAALVLAPGRAAGRPQLELHIESRDAPLPTPAVSPAAALLADNVLAPCLPLFELLARETPGAVTLALAGHMVLHVCLRS